jgi:hypothetical protein
MVVAEHRYDDTEKSANLWHNLSGFVFTSAKLRIIPLIIHNRTKKVDSLIVSDRKRAKEGEEATTVLQDCHSLCH